MDDICECQTCGRMHRHLGNPPWALSYVDMQRLAIAFCGTPEMRTTQGLRISQWLRRMIAVSDKSELRTQNSDNRG